MSPEALHLQRLANQRLETELLLGVDFFPVTTEYSESQAPVSEGTADQESPRQDKNTALKELSERAITAFPFCESLSEATQPVFGEGDVDARLMFIGEAPGAEEDRTGRPFVGAAGQKLDQMIAALGYSREEVYITNILKARPPENRTPTSDEIASSTPWLIDQIRIIKPEVIMTLGGPATQFILDTSEGITRLRGRWGAYTDDALHIPVMPTFHPAYLLRNYTKETRLQVWNDFQKVMELLGLQTQEDKK